MEETKKTRKKWWLTPLIVIITGLIIGVYVGFLLRDDDSAEEPPAKTTTERKVAIAKDAKPKITLYPCNEPAKKKRVPHRAKPAPQQVVAVAQAPKAGTECVAGAHHGTMKLVDGKMNCVWTGETAKAQSALQPTLPAVMEATAPVAPVITSAFHPTTDARPVLSGADTDYGKTEVASSPFDVVEELQNKRRIVVVVDQPQYYRNRYDGGWYNAPYPSPYYYATSPTYYASPQTVYAPAQQVVTQTPSVVTSVGHAPAVITRPAGPGVVTR